MLNGRHKYRGRFRALIHLLSFVTSHFLTRSREQPSPRRVSRQVLGRRYIVLPQSRVQFIAEYSGIIFVGAATRNNTFE